MTVSWSPGIDCRVLDLVLVNAEGWILAKFQPYPGHLLEGAQHAHPEPRPRFCWILAKFQPHLGHHRHVLIWTLRERGSVVMGPF